MGSKKENPQALSWVLDINPGTGRSTMLVQFDACVTVEYAMAWISPLLAPDTKRVRNTDFRSTVLVRSQIWAHMEA